MIAQAFEPQPIIIEVDNDTTINVREALNLPDSIFLYGEKFNGKQYGGRKNALFEEHQVTPNEKNGIEIVRDSNNIIQIKIHILESAEQNCTLKFKCAYSKAKDDWHPDDNNIMSLIIKKKAESEITDKSNASLSINLYKFAVIFILAIIVCAVCVIIRCNKQIKKAKEDVLCEVKQLLQNKVDIDNNASCDIYKEDKKKSADIQQVLTITDVESLINKAIAQYECKQHSCDVHNDISSDVKSMNQSNIVSSIDTDNVVFDMSSNTFSIGDTDIKIFRIYSEGDKYFYSIVHDQKVREEFLNMITSFSSCVYVTNPSFQNAKSLEPCEDGKLIKIGDNKYSVDPNNILKLKLV